MAETWKHLYDLMKKMVAMYQDEIVPGLRKQVEELEAKIATDNNVGSKWIPVTERLPNNFVSVLGYMTDAGDFPPVRECYTVGRAFFFPALGDAHPVSHWMPLPEPPKEEAQQDCTYNKDGHCMGQKMMPECDQENCDRRVSHGHQT